MNISALRVLALAAVALVTGCVGAPTAPPVDKQNAENSEYLIGAGDMLDIFVWRNPELSARVPVRPDGRVSTPLVEDVDAVGKTPTQLGRDIEERLKKFVRDPIVTVITENFVGDFDQQVRVIGEAAEPRAVPYREKMTLLDVIIQVGGLTKYAAGNRAVVVRKIGGEEDTFPARLDELIKYGDVRYNFEMQPGDILIVPQSYF